ncbi:hypothetical protein IT418_01415 [bacterium]|nr:hypothetical protein [bacterium]
MNNITNYIKTFIENTDNISVLTGEEQKQIQFEGVVSYILKKINSSKYKQSKFPQVVSEKVEKIVVDAVKNHRPIYFSIPFGGFKKWQLPHYPNIGWEEIFNIIQLRNFAVEIAKGYEPGVVIHYFSDEIFIARMNNMSQKDLDTYNNQFNLAVAYIQQFAPSNVMLRYSKIRDELSQQEILKRFDKGIVELKKSWKTTPKDLQEMKLNKTARNYKIDEKNKYSKVDLKNIYFESTLVHDAFTDTEWEQGTMWAFQPYMIPVGFRYTKTWGINLKSSPTSTVQFWVGYGILEAKDEKFSPKTLTFNQYEAIKNRLIFEKCEAISLAIPSLSKIPVLR